MRGLIIDSCQKLNNDNNLSLLASLSVSVVSARHLVDFLSRDQCSLSFSSYARSVMCILFVHHHVFLLCIGQL